MAPVGKSWPAHRYEVGTEKIREYATAIGEEAAHFRDHDAARALGLAAVAAPPTFATVFCAPAVAAGIFDPEVGLYDPAAGIDSYRFVHRRQQFEWLRPVCAGETIETVARLIDAGEDDRGRTYRTFGSESVDTEGRLVLRARYEGIVPGPSRPAAGSRRRHDSFRAGEGGFEPAAPRTGMDLPTHVLTPDRLAPVRYAGASGDFTPFHLDAELARALGFPGVILHGLYSFAQLARAQLAPFGSDPRVLRSLRGRFARPALPERELRVRSRVVSVDGGEGGELRTEGVVVQGGETVIADGAATLDLSYRRA